jgi:hypothetical protein
MLLASSVFLSGAVLLAGETIPNWPAPATWSPSRSSGGMAPMDVSPPLPFIGLAPCRLLDTRGNGFSGAYGPPSLVAGVTRSFTLAGQCGIPSGAGAVSLNVTVTNTLGPGFILIYPQGGTQPLVSTVNYVAGQTIANAAVVPLGSGGGVSFIAGVSGTDLVVDTNGYYASAAANQGNTFTVINSGANGIPAILGQTNSASGNATGVEGLANSPTGTTTGVLGENHSNADGATGVVGFAVGGGANTGTLGTTLSSSDGAAGVLGYGGGAATALMNYRIAGVRGEALSGFGVLGISQSYGVGGSLVNFSGSLLTYGLLGTVGPPALGVYYGGGLAGFGTKSFLEPHPTDATKIIRYVSLEGPEAGTYFRGTDQTSHGTAVILVPDSFRLVTDTEGLTVQLTPVGAAATLYVVSQDLNQIVVRSSRDVKFHYMVNGVRKAYPHWEAIQENESLLVPTSAVDRLPAWLSEEERGRLIRNGTYNADGTVNLATAERLGWTKVWANRAIATPKNSSGSREIR